MITDSYIQRVTKNVLLATLGADEGRLTYLRTLIEASQEKSKKGDETKAQVALVSEAHERFYRIALAIVSELVPAGTKGRAVELHRRINFTRTAASAVRKYVKAGNELLSIKADKATKRSLAVTLPGKPTSAKAFKTRLEHQAKTLVATVAGLAVTDREAAIAEINLVVGQLRDQLAALGVASTKDAGKSIAQFRPLRIGKNKELFMPSPSKARTRTDGAGIVLNG